MNDDPRVRRYSAILTRLAGLAWLAGNTFLLLTQGFASLELVNRILYPVVAAAYSLWGIVSVVSLLRRTRSAPPPHTETA